MGLSGGMRRLLIIVHPYLSEVVRGELLCLTYNLPLFSARIFTGQVPKRADVSDVFGH